MTAGAEQLLGHRRLLVATAVEAERDAVLAGLGPLGTAVRVSGTVLGLGTCVADVAALGVGPAAAAAATARLLTRAEAESHPYSAVLSAGIGGGFAGRVAVGGVAVATRCVAADLGADSPGGFLPLDELGFGATVAEVDADLLAGLRTVLPDAVAGAVLTVSTVTGTAAVTGALTARYPDAVAEAMEGFGVATAAQQAGVPFGELRTVSNLIGPRDRSAWRIPAALSALTGAFQAVAKLAL